MNHIEYHLTTADDKEWLAIPHACQVGRGEDDEFYWYIEMHCRADRNPVALHMSCYEQARIVRTEANTWAAAGLFLEALGYVQAKETALV